jgi:membrane protease YdiL (CAAX protease family)
MHVRWSRVSIFYAICLAGIGTAGALLFSLGEDAGIWATVLAALAMFSPMLATVVMHKMDGKTAFDGLAKVSLNRWILAAMGLPITMALLTICVSALLPGTTVDLTMMAFLDQYSSIMSPEELAEAKQQIGSIPGGAIGLVLLSIPQAVVAGATLNAVFAFGEEVGWRGWLQRELAPLGFWRANLVTGTLWGFWHAPLILNGHNYPVHRFEGVFLFVLVCIVLSPMLAWLRERSGSVWTAAIAHGVINASAGLSMMLVVGPDLIVGLPGVAGVLVFGGLSVVLFLRMKSIAPQTEPQTPL